MGIIEDSGLYVNDEHAAFDGGSRDLFEDMKLPEECCCGKVIVGIMNPDQCPMFGKGCTPMKPLVHAWCLQKVHVAYGTGTYTDILHHIIYSDSSHQTDCKEEIMKITMAHGSGGKSSAQLMSDIFGKHFENQVLDRMEDAAVLEVSGRIACSTDSFVVTPLVFRGGDIGKLCVCGTDQRPSDDGCGAEISDLRIHTGGGAGYGASDDGIVESMAAQAREAGVIIVAGDTKVVEGSGGLYINTTGIGEIPDGRDVSSRNCRPGDVVILSGNLGDHHACILSHRMGDASEIQSDCAALNGVTVDALFAEKIDVACPDVTRGGLGTVLNEIAESSSCMVELEEESIPVHDDVQRICGYTGTGSAVYGQ